MPTGSQILNHFEVALKFVVLCKFLLVEKKSLLETFLDVFWKNPKGKNVEKQTKTIILKILLILKNFFSSLFRIKREETI